MVDSDYPENCIVNIYFVKGIARNVQFSDEYYCVTYSSREYNEIHVHRKGNKFRLLDIGNNTFCGLNDLCRLCAKHFRVMPQYMQKIFVLSGLSSSSSVWRSNEEPVRFWECPEIRIGAPLDEIEIPLAGFPKAALKETTAIYTSILANYDSETYEYKNISEEYSEFKQYKEIIDDQLYYVDELESCAFIVPTSIYLMHFTEEDVLEYTKEAEKGNEYAQYYLAKAYLDEEYPGKDMKKGICWLQKACERKNGLALVRLGEIYAEGEYFVKQNLIHAYVCFKAAEDVCYGDESIAYRLKKLVKNMSKKEITVANSMNYKDSALALSEQS